MIYFVGAGSGAVDLITVRGAELLKKADVIIYAGSLVNPELLKYAKNNCRIYNSALMTLDDILKVMYEAESVGNITVRLHTGDPCIYGAIREQADALTKRNIEYEIVPGVSSLCAAAAAIKAEYTLPNVSQTVIITRMAGRTAVPIRENIRSLSIHKSTMVIFLSAGLLNELQNELLEGGYEKDTKAAIVYKATWPDEAIYRCTVGTLAKTAAENNVKKTALILVGDFLGNTYEKSKLYSSNFTTGFREGIY